MMVVVGEEDCLAVHDAKPNVGICQRSFGKVATRMSYIWGGALSANGYGCLVIAQPSQNCQIIFSLTLKEN